MQVSNFDTLTRVLAADAVNGATFNIPLPVGRTSGLYGGDHKMGLPAPMGGEEYSSLSGRFSVGFGTAGFVTVTNNTGRTLPAGATVYVQLERPGINGEVLQSRPVDRLRLEQTVLVDVGTPLAAVANGLAVSQTVALNANMVLAKSVMDVPRNVTAAWTTAAVCTVRGKDEFGAAMTEQSASGTAFTGKKAFATIDSIRFSAAVTLATAGFGGVLGLPVYINKVTDVLRVSTATVIETSTQWPGVVIADPANPTGLTGDVRGTWVPTAPIAINGTNTYVMAVNAFDMYYRGRPQYAG